MKTGNRQIDHNLNDSNGGRPKREPSPHAVDLCRVEDLGAQDYYEKQPTGPFDRSIYDGPGYKNTPGVSVDPPCRPGGGRSVMRSGSQGRR